jgi:hypothetical protein
MNRHAPSRVLAFACVNALASLALMAWSLFDPRPLPVIAAMSLGQVLGTISFVLYLSVALASALRRPKPQPGSERVSSPR